jgi:hypothetical protein
LPFDFCLLPFDFLLFICGEAALCSPSPGRFFHSLQKQARKHLTREYRRPWKLVV